MLLGYVFYGDLRSSLLRKLVPMRLHPMLFSMSGTASSKYGLQMFPDVLPPQ